MVTTGAMSWSPSCSCALPGGLGAVGLSWRPYGRAAADRGPVRRVPPACWAGGRQARELGLASRADARAASAAAAKSTRSGSPAAAFAGGSGAGVRLLVGGSQPLHRHVGVDLGARQRRVAED